MLTAAHDLATDVDGSRPSATDRGHRLIPPIRQAPSERRIRHDPSLYFAAMSIRPIVMLGDPRLRLKGKPVDSFGRYLHELLDDLAQTMRDAPGVGLAAPQLGEPLQACVIEVERQLYELVNPTIVRSSGDDRDLEGCLSIPGYVAYVTRRERVWVVAQNRMGRKIRVAGSGLLGRALQHELDHLEGKLYIDYLESMDELLPVGQGNEDDAEVREATSALA
jgi:peptide deformylase